MDTQKDRQADRVDLSNKKVDDTCLLVSNYGTSGIQDCFCHLPGNCAYRVNQKKQIPEQQKPTVIYSPFPSINHPHMHTLLPSGAGNTSQ